MNELEARRDFERRMREIDRQMQQRVNNQTAATSNENLRPYTTLYKSLFGENYHKKQLRGTLNNGRKQNSMLEFKNQALKTKNMKSAKLVDKQKSSILSKTSFNRGTDLNDPNAKSADLAVKQKRTTNESPIKSLSNLSIFDKELPRENGKNKRKNTMTTLEPQAVGLAKNMKTKTPGFQPMTDYQRRI